MMKQENTTLLTTRAPAPGREKKRGGGWRKLLLYMFGLGLLGALVAGLWPQPVRVETAAAVRGPLTVSVLEEGKTRIRHRYVITPPVAGYLNRVELRAGARIRAGQTVLATIQAESTGLLNPRTRAEAEAHEKATEAARQQRQADVERARASLDLAQKEFTRSDALSKEGIIARREWDTAENRVRVLARELGAAEFALRTAEFEVAQAKAALQQAKAPEPGESQTLRIVAPVDGFVLNVYEESARVIAAGTPIMEVGDPRDLEAEIELLSSDAVAVAPGADVSIEQWGGEAPLRGRVSLVERGGFTKISALGVEEQRVRVRVDFLDPAPPGRELGDRFRVEARIVTWHGDDVLQIPSGALFRRGGDWMAFAVEHGQARLRKVEIGHTNGLAAEVRSGLAPGEAVIGYPPDSVADGTRVAAAPAAGASGHAVK